MRDVSQSLGRQRCSVFDVEHDIHFAPTVTPGQVMMLTDGDKTPRLLLGREALWMHGFPILQKSIKDILDSENESFL